MPRFRNAAIVVAAVGAVFTAAVALRWGGAGVTNAVDDLGEAAAALIAAGVAWTAARRGTETRRAWTCLSASAAAWGAGELVWSYYDLVTHRPVPFPSLADAGFLSAVPLAVLALLSFPGAPRRAARLVRVGLDGAVVATSLLFVSWALVLGPQWHTTGQTLLAQTISLAYPVGDVIIVTIVCLVLTRAQPGHRVPLALVGAGLVAMAVADSAFAVLTNNSSFGIGNGLDGGWVVGYLLIALAALYPAARRRGPAFAAPTGGPAAVMDTRVMVFLPSVPLLAAVAVGALRLADHHRMGPFLAITGAVLVGLVCVRQAVALLDNLQLGRSLQNMVGRLSDREAELTYQAFHDPLTSLANRALLWDRIGHASAVGERDGSVLAVLYIDLDGFKTVNDNLGHAAGDQLLAAVAERLRAVVRPSETIARIGGDEFAVLVERIGVGGPEGVAYRLLDALAVPFVVGGLNVVVGASIGIAVSAGGAPTADEMVRVADAAMYEAKRDDTGPVVLRELPPSLDLRLVNGE